MIVYKTTNLKNGKFYIGQDTKNNPEYLGSGKLIQKAIQKYGKENFIKEILVEVSTQKELNEMEIYWIDKLNSTDKNIGYNIMPGGEGISKGMKLPIEWIENIRRGHTGMKYSEEHKKKISEGQKGRIQTAETRDKISKSHSNKKLSEEHKKRIREGCKGINKGKKHTEESIEKMRAAKKGKAPWNKGLSMKIISN